MASSVPLTIAVPCCRFSLAAQPVLSHVPTTLVLGRWQQPPALGTASLGPAVGLQAGRGTEGEVEVVERDPSQQGLSTKPAAAAGKSRAGPEQRGHLQKSQKRKGLPAWIVTQNTSSTRELGLL